MSASSKCGTEGWRASEGETGRVMASPHLLMTVLGSSQLPLVLLVRALSGMAVGNGNKICLSQSRASATQHQPPYQLSFKRSDKYFESSLTQEATEQNNN
jgi:hypothetical protein